MADWQIPILRRLTLSGEFYRGRGVGGLGAAIGQTILFGGNPGGATAPIHGLDSAGGWSQLKFQLTPKLELNGVLAEDNAFASDVRGFATMPITSERFWDAIEVSSPIWFTGRDLTCCFRRNSDVCTLFPSMTVPV